MKVSPLEHVVTLECMLEEKKPVTNRPLDITWFSAELSQTLTSFDFHVNICMFDEENLLLNF